MKYFPITKRSIAKTKNKIVKKYLLSGIYFQFAAVQLFCGIVELVCGFAVSEAVDDDQLPFYFRTMMPLWVGAVVSRTKKFVKKRRLQETKSL